MATGETGNRRTERRAATPSGVRRAPSWRADSLFFRALEPESGWDDGREAVYANQRARMLDAMSRAVASKGYARVSVADVVELAGVSRRTFYEQFTDKEHCFLIAYETGTEALIEEMVARAAAVDGVDWHGRLRAALDAYTGILAGEPEFARAVLIDVLGAGPRAVELRRVVYERFVEQYRALSALAAHEEPGGRPVPDLYLRALVGGIGELVGLHVLEHGAGTLPELAPDLVALVTAVFAGARRSA
jgi:AcrR family transcriptional regulator